jgi:beta-galactosidase
MVRLWTLEALAHGAELVCYFRWRQAPFAQEQMHAGLLRPDSSEAEGLVEARQASADIASLGPIGAPVREVALVFSYESEWVTATQPHGRDFSALWAAFDCYSALRKLGLNVDIVPPGADLEGYALVVVPCLPIADEAFSERLSTFAGSIVIGARSGSRTASFAIPDGLAPGTLTTLIGAKVLRVESLRPGLVHEGAGFTRARWHETLAGEATAEFTSNDGGVAVWKNGRVRYLACWPEPGLGGLVFRRAAEEAGLSVIDLPAGMRLRRSRGHSFVFNYGTESVAMPGALTGEVLLGDRVLPPAGVTVLG